MPNWDRRVVWQSSAYAWAKSRTGMFLNGVAERRGFRISHFDNASRWSAINVEAFWSDIVDEFDINLGCVPSCGGIR